MYVREYMKTPVITVTPDTLLDDALRTMNQHHIRRLPVVVNGKLVGLVTRHGLQEATPPLPTPLSMWAAHYQLSRMKVRDIMITDVITVTPDSTVEEAAALLEQQKIGTLPVVDKDGNVVGILTGSDLLRLLTQVMGFGQKGVRLHILNLGSNKEIRQRQIMAILSRHEVDVLSAFSVPLADVQQEDFIVHLDTEEAVEIVEELKKLGLKVEVREH
jgi:acetoin utilization protein AcuB